ncbi:MAG TPA: tetratricopeptide repeat protein [Pyrinomonadaceae bacterium]
MVLAMNRHFNLRRLLSLFALAAFLLQMSQGADAQRSRKASATGQASAKSITVKTEPKAVVWLDEVRRGVTDDAGRLTLLKVSAGRHSLRVRARGFREASMPVAPARRGAIEVKLVRTTDEAELLFQQAEEARETARDEEARKLSAETYRRALRLRQRFAAAHLGLARVLLELNDYNTALEEINAARAARPVYPEASAVEGRILRMAADTNAAMESFRRAIREARGFQPEAHTGLALLLEDKGRYEEATEEFRAAILQLSDTEPVLYQLLGAAYEKLQKYKEAVQAYEKYLELAPEGTLAPAVRSILDQLRRQAAEQEGAPNP